LVALAASGAWTSASTQDGIEIGLLQCSVLEPVEPESGGAAGQTRRVSCAFRPKNGAEETYVGKVQVANRSLGWKGTLLWSVNAPPESLAVPGLLRQSYAADPRTPAGQIPRMIGEQNSGVVLQTMSDVKEGSSSAGSVLGVQLDLTATIG
jgi:hypothetical protein